MTAKRDYYESLGVDKKADLSSIKKAYRKLAKKYHPDTNAGNAKAEERFKEITEAYNVLSNEEKKKLYDEFGFAGLEEGFSAEAARDAAGGGYNPFHQGFQSGPYTTHQEFHFENGAGGMDADDIFADMFGGFFHQGSAGFGQKMHGFHTESYGGSRSEKGSDVEAEITIDFKEAIYGCEKSISLQDGHGGCVQKFSVHIPAGIDTGKTVRLKGKGTPGYHGGAAGDVLLKVNVKKSSEYVRKGQDIYSTVRIPFTTAALGGKIRVHTLYGDVECNIKEGTQAGSKVRLKGKGVVSMKNKNLRGDQYVTIEIQVPMQLTPQAREALQQYEKAMHSTQRAG